MHTCSQGPRQHRHNAIANVWRGILKEAQYHTQLEQNVLLPDGTLRKADITALHASGHHLALDVMVTGNPDPTLPATAHLSQQERGKAARYGTRPNGPLPGGITCVPLLHLSGDLFMGSSALLLLYKLCLSIARSSAPSDPLAWGAHVASTFHRQCQALAYTLCLHDFRMHLSCGCLL